MAETVNKDESGDLGFLGVDLRNDPRNLDPGIAAGAWNKDFSLLSADSRKGHRTVEWAHEFGVNFPLRFPFDFDVKQGLGKIYGTVDFSDPESGMDFTLLAAASGTYMIMSNARYRMINYPAGDEGVSGPVLMVQTFSKVMMFRGSEQEPLMWDPYDDDLWKTVAESTGRTEDPAELADDGTYQIPNSAEACVFKSRVFAVKDRDTVVASDSLDYTRYPPENSFRVNNGTGDAITRLYPFNEQTLIVLKGLSINLLTNVYGDLSAVDNDLLTTEYGCLARDTVATIGADVWFLAYGGVYTVVQTMQNKLQGDTVPVSFPITPLMKRVNWSAAVNACAAYYENKYYLAVPLDGATYNNTLLVYDFINKQWFGGWSHEWMDIGFFCRILNQDSRRLFYVNSDRLDEPKAHGAVFMMNSGERDELFDAAADVEDELLTRGYTAGSTAPKNFEEIAVEISTKNPVYDVSLLTDGVNEEFVLAGSRTKNPVKYYAFSRADWDPTNINDDHGVPGRQDYSVIFPAEHGMSFPVDFPVDFVDGFYTGGGVNPDEVRRVQEPFRCRARGGFVQIRIRGKRGTVRVHGTAVSAYEGKHSFRVVK